MESRIFAGLFLFYLFSVAGGGAQSVEDNEKPAWTMESIKVKPGMLGITLGYLDDNWMRIREEAKRQGAVLSYHCIAEEGSRESDRKVILLTEYKNQASYNALDTQGVAEQYVRQYVRTTKPSKTSSATRPL